MEGKRDNLIQSLLIFLLRKIKPERLSGNVASTCPTGAFSYSPQTPAHAYSSHSMNTADFGACHQPCMWYRLLIRCFCVCLLQYPWHLLISGILLVVKRPRNASQAKITEFSLIVNIYIPCPFQLKSLGLAFLALDLKFMQICVTAFAYSWKYVNLLD